MSSCLPSDRYDAEFSNAKRTPRDDHENLYPKGLPEHSGAGSPPQYDRNCLTY